MQKWRILKHLPALDANACQHKIRLALAFERKNVVNGHVQSKVVQLFDVRLFVFSVLSR